MHYNELILQAVEETVLVRAASGERRASNAFFILDFIYLPLFIFTVFRSVKEGLRLLRRYPSTIIEPNAAR